MNKRTLFIAVLAGLVLAMPAALRAETNSASPIRIFQAVAMADGLYTQLNRQYQKTEKQRSVGSATDAQKAIVTFGLTWRNVSDSSERATRCKGALLADKNRVITSPRCFLAEKNFGSAYELKKIVLILQNGKKAAVGLKSVQQSGDFAFVEVSPQATAGLNGVNLHLLPGSQSLSDHFKEGAPYTLFHFMGEIVRANRFYRTGHFDIEKWSRGAVLGEPVFYQNKLIAINVVNARYHYFIKEKPLFLIFNETNGGGTLIK